MGRPVRRVLLEDLEVLARQAAHRVALLVGHVDLDVDHVDVEAVEEDVVRLMVDQLLI